MHIYVNGRNIEITDAIKAYVKEKLAPVYWLLSLLFQFTGRYGIEF